MLESATPNTELRAKPHLAKNAPHSRSVNLLLPPKHRFETIPEIAQLYPEQLAAGYRAYRVVFALEAANAAKGN